MKRGVRYLPAGLFLVLVGALVWRLAHPSDTNVRSRLQGRPLPGFTLPAALPGKPGLASAELKGRAHLVNLFASWCVPCITELPLLEQLQADGASVVGIDVRDRPEALAGFLAAHGDPFAAIGNDRDSVVQLALGSSGVPETFVIDREGIVRRQFVGGISPRDLPEIRRAIGVTAQ